jgi:hypothetical protein
MFFTHSTFLGIDPTAGQRPFSYAALDSNLHLLALGQGSMEEVLAFAGGQRQAFAAVCAPRQPNQRLMERPEVRERLSPAPRPGRWADFRLAEYELRQRNINCYKTPADESACPHWMQAGFTLYRRLEGLGYQAYPTAGQALQSLEVYPRLLLRAAGQTPLPKNTFEGRIRPACAVRPEDRRARPDGAVRRDHPPPPAAGYPAGQTCTARASWMRW